MFVFRFAHNFLAIGTDPAERSGGGGGFREGCIDLIKFKINLNIVNPPPLPTTTIDLHIDWTHRENWYFIKVMHVNICFNIQHLLICIDSS